MAARDSFNDSGSDVDVFIYDKRNKYLVNGEKFSTPSSMKRNEVDFPDEINFPDEVDFPHESDPEEDYMSNKKLASRTSSIKRRKKKKSKSPRKYSSSQLVDSDSPYYLKKPYVKKKKSGVSFSKRSLNNEREFEVSPPTKRRKCSVETRFPDKNDSFPSFLQAISIESSSESETNSMKSEKYLGTWGEKYDFQDKEPILPECSASDDSDNDWIQERKEEYSGHYRVFGYPYQNIEVIILNHPAKVVLLNYVSIRVISGSICVQGYEMNRDVLPITVFSSKRTGFIVLKTEYPEEIWKKKVLFSRIRRNLKEMVPESLVQDILSKCSNSTIIVALKKVVQPPALRFLGLYYPLLFAFETPKVYSQSYEKNLVLETIVFDTPFEQLADKIKYAIQKSKLKNLPGQRILVFGNKKTGKSTLLQYLINKALSMFLDIYYLDTDPGQTEFTPPGVVSLTKVKSPLIGSPFLHQKLPVKMIFTGSVSPETSPPMFEKSVRHLAEIYKSTYSSSTLFVNTMGWVTGIGLECLQSVIKAIEPTIMIEILNREKPAKINYQEIMDTTTMKYFQIDCKAPILSCSTLKPPENRNFSVLSYLGGCQKPHLDTAYLNDFKPFCVSWDVIPIYIFGKRLVPYRIVEAINASFVALCHVDESLIRESDIPCFQKTLEEDPDNECLGFGVVRAVDEENHLLYIVTPLSEDELNDVNAIMKGNIQLPKEIFLNQPILNTPLPFTDTSAPGLRRSLRNRNRKRTN